MTWLAALVLVSGCAGPEADDDAPPPSQAGSAGSAAATPEAHNTLTPQEQAAGWQLLFDGASTAGWRAYGGGGFPTGGWAVEDGVLKTVAPEDRGDGPAGDIITEAVFSDFELVFDFLVTPVGNSGVFYRVVEHEGETLWQVAPEYQVLDDSAYLAMEDLDMETHLTGDNYDLQSSGVTASNPVGEWNHGRILVDGSHVEHWLNGQMTVEYELGSPEWEGWVAESKFAEWEHYGRAAEGSIGLQDHDREVRYRNIKIRPLGETATRGGG